MVVVSKFFEKGYTRMNRDVQLMLSGLNDEKTVERFAQKVEIGTYNSHKAGMDWVEK